MASKNLEKKVIFIRLMVGIVAVAEGLGCLLSGSQGGLLAQTGFLSSQATTAVFSIMAIVFGGLVLAGFKARLAAIPLLLLFAMSFLTTQLVDITKEGLPALRAASTHFCMIMGSLYIFFAGAGAFSMDARPPKAQKT